MQRKIKIQTMQPYSKNEYKIDSLLENKLKNKSAFHCKTTKSRRAIDKCNNHHQHNVSTITQNIQFYQRMQQNQRIMRRIINPKRDKIILKSIENLIIRSHNANKYNNTIHSHPFCIQRMSNRAKSQYNLQRKNTRYFYKEKEQWKQNDKEVDKNQNIFQGYELKLENQRMGRRIINTTSIVRNLITADSENRSKIGNQSKVNNGVKAFFNVKSQPRESVKKQAQNFTIHRLKPYYGYGPTILCFTKIKIESNPQLKNNDLICLELLVKNNVKPKLYRTDIIPYEMLNLEQTCIKFAVRLKKIGEYVPLKIWRVQGVQNIQIGIVDIQFTKYLYQQQSLNDSGVVNTQEKAPFEFDSKNSGSMIQYSNQGKIRKIVSNKIECKFRKQKVEQSHVSVLIQYLIYRKRYI